MRKKTDTVFILSEQVDARCLPQASGFSMNSVHGFLTLVHPCPLPCSWYMVISHSHSLPLNWQGDIHIGKIVDSNLDILGQLFSNINGSFSFVPGWLGILKEPEMDGFRIPQNSRSFQHFPTMCQPFQYLSDLGFLHDLLRTPLFLAGSDDRSAAEELGNAVGRRAEDPGMKSAILLVIHQMIWWCLVGVLLGTLGEI